MDRAFHQVYELCKDHTMTSLSNMYALYKATEYVTRAGVRGDIVECGVWRGGSAMVVASTLKALGDTTRTLYLYDTYEEGMTEPDRMKDVQVLDGKSAHAKWTVMQGNNQKWHDAPMEEVRNSLRRTGYPMDHVVFVRGRVEDTIPSAMPSDISLLRLDTDWYASTRHELIHLFPLLSDGGVLIIDDYGHWKGARDAVDEYFTENHVTLLLNRIDYTARIGIKTQ